MHNTIQALGNQIAVSRNIKERKKQNRNNRQWQVFPVLTKINRITKRNRLQRIVPSAQSKPKTIRIYFDGYRI